MFKISVISIAVSIIIFSKESFATKCYNCGYLVDADGQVGPITEGKTSAPFCPGTDRDNWPTREAKEGHCCASYTGNIGNITQQTPSNSQTNLKMGPYPHKIVRHGLDTDGDEFEFKLNCTNTGSVPPCKEENLMFNDGPMEEAVVCQCNEDKCNGENFQNKGTSIQFRQTYLSILLCLLIMFISF